MISGPCGLAPVSFSAASVLPAELPRVALALGLRRRRGPGITGIGVLIVEQRSICLGSGADGAGRRQHRNLPKPDALGPLVRNRYARNTRTQNPMPAHAHIPRIPELRIQWPDIHLLSQTRKAFTSVSLVMPVLFALSVAKKPHIPLNEPARQCTAPAFPCGIRPLHRGMGRSAAFAVEISMTSKAIVKCDGKWRILALAVLALTAVAGQPGRRPPTSRI